MGDRGFVFLFNPNARRLDAQFRLDGSIGLAGRGRFEVRELYPLSGRRLAKPVDRFLDRRRPGAITMDGQSALMLEVTPAPAGVSQPMLFGAPGRASLSGGVLDLRDVRGEIGTRARLVVVVPAASTVRAARVNGTDIPVMQRQGNAVSIDVGFAGERFGTLHALVPYDSTFRGGRLAGSFRIPKRIFDQLAARRRAWPIPWTSEDYRTTWLAPERLLLYVQIAEPDDRWEARLTIEGRPVELRKAYSSVRPVRHDFVGFYADLSLLDPDREYRFTLDLPALGPGQFQGLFVENVEPEYTTAIVPPR